jgi:hypothetical protein
VKKDLHEVWCVIWLKLDLHSPVPASPMTNQAIEGTGVSIGAMLRRGSSPHKDENAGPAHRGVIESG